MGDGIVQSCRVRGEISRALGQSRHRGEHVVGAGAAAAAVVAEEKSFGPPVINVGNVQRAANRESERVAVVVGFFLGLSAERVRLGVKDGATIIIEDGAVGLVDVEAAHAASTAARSTA